ncbi:MAG: hypothetical protein KDA58_08685 [Planctomycetaceae bacterium]|nr:hypothetical protein [Planctomycetaceae bacterium]
MPRSGLGKIMANQCTTGKFPAATMPPERKERCPAISASIIAQVKS